MPRKLAQPITACLIFNLRRCVLVAEEKQDEKQEEVNGQFKQELTDTEAALGAEAEICIPPEDINKIMNALDEKGRLLDEMNERYKRLQADFDNFRRRTRQEKEELSIIVTERILGNLLPVVDNFERATASVATDVNTLSTGVEMIFRQLNNVLAELGVEPVNAVGNMFDPTQHEAVMRMQDANQPDGMIIEELQKGYKVNGRVIRPSMVKVATNN